MSAQAEYSRHQVDAALAAARDSAEPPEERAAMLVDIATALHRRAHSPQTLSWAAELYRRAGQLYPSHCEQQRVRAGARAVAAEVMAGLDDADALRAALDALTLARDALAVTEDRLETAHCDMTLGIVQQQLCALGAAPPGDAIVAYQRALRVLSRTAHPCEFAIMQSNLATLYLQRRSPSPLHEALAVQALEAALAALDAHRHPNEYGMVQNNLGNALQSVRSAHPLENLERAIAAYDASLRVRRRSVSPQAYAMTLSNKASCLSRMPDAQRRQQARALFAEAAEAFAEAGDPERGQRVCDMIEELDSAAA